MPGHTKGSVVYLLVALAEYRFNQLFSGHGPWSPWRDQDEMRVLLLALTERMEVC